MTVPDKVKVRDGVEGTQNQYRIESKRLEEMLVGAFLDGGVRFIGPEERIPKRGLHCRTTPNLARVVLGGVMEHDSPRYQGTSTVVQII